jgi:TonB-linked SusC/RagA family outer membrane protein
MQKSVEVCFYVRYKPCQSTKTSDPGDPTVWRGIQRAMKITSAFILVAVMHVSASGVAQKISFTGENVPLTKVFNAIEDQLGFGVLMPHKLLESSKLVTVKIKDGTLDDLLQKCFEFQPWKVSYTVTGHTIYISQVYPSSDQTKDIPPGKNVKVTGSVFNESGQPLSGANVTIKETQKGTITNAKGEFDLGWVPSGSTVIVSFVGYAPEVLKINEETSAKIYLKQAKNELDRAVVQAYGLTTQRLNTGDIAVVTSDQIERQPVTNPLQALEGQVPGLVVQQTSGYASAPFKVEIRGRNSISDLPSEPLYIIDGVPLTILTTNNDNYESGSSGFLQNGLGGPASGQSPFFSINPSDIESISVLKDADATAIYGSRGANGVIIITTKKGRPGKAKLDITFRQGISKVTSYYQMLNTQQYLEVRREAFKNDGIVPDAGSAPDLQIWDTTRYTDWQKVLWGGLGQNSNATVSLSGGNVQSTFRLSGSYDRETSILSYSGADQRASVQFNLSHKSLDQKLSLSFTSIYSYAQSNMIEVGGSVTLPPDAPAIWNSEGALNYAGWQPNSDLFSFGNLLQPYTAKTSFLNSQLNIGYELLKGLSLSANLGYSTNYTSQISLEPIISQDPSTNPKGSSQFGNNTGSRTIVEPQIEYKGLVSKGKFDGLIGATLQNVTQSGNRIIGTGYTDDNLLESISNAPVKNAENVAAQYKYAAIFGRINYNWEDKYIVNITARRDGSSRFGPGKQFGEFGAVGGAWIFTEESWLKDHFKFLDFGKLRGSYGITGNDLIGDYQYLTQWSASGTFTYNGSATYVPLLHANPNLHWEVNKKLEGAVDLGFFKDRVNLEAAWYRNLCGDQLVSMVLPGITGFTSVTANFPALVQNTGLEGTLKVKFVDAKDFTWLFNFDIGVNRNKLAAFPNILNSPYAYSLFVGQPLNINNLLICTGVDPQTGQYTFKDKNHDGQITANYGPTDDLYPINLSVKMDGGFGTDLQYKSWQLNLFFHFVSQEAPAAIFASVPGGFSNQSVQILNRWQYPGDVAKYARYTTGGVQTDYDFSTSNGTLSNASYVRLQNASLSFDLSKVIDKRIGLRACKIYVRGQNLFVLTSYNGLDPETHNFGLMPPAKIVICGIQADF